MSTHIAATVLSGEANCTGTRVTGGTVPVHVALSQHWQGPKQSMTRHSHSVWPRDSSYTHTAADHLVTHSIRAPRKVAYESEQRDTITGLQGNPTQFARSIAPHVVHASKIFVIHAAGPPTVTAGSYRGSCGGGEQQKPHQARSFNVW